MKNIVVGSVILAAAIAAGGCHTMREGSDRGGQCKSCCAADSTKCQKCGMHKGHCKCMAKAAPMAEINTSALKALVNSGVPLTLVDARTGKYDDGRRIGKAITLSPEAKDDAIASALPSKDALIVTYCVNTKCPASVILAKKLTGMGYTRVLEYPQGIEGWVAEGNPVTQPAK